MHHRKVNEPGMQMKVFVVFGLEHGGNRIAVHIGHGVVDIAYYEL
jgi:hypothetical protein